MTHVSHRLFLLCFLLIVGVAAFFRFFQLSTNPPSLYWEEVALGYDAYSILKTGKDFHGNPWPLVAFESFGDWKPSLYFYAAAPAIGLFGLNEFAVRLPSAVAGLAIVIGSGVLARKYLQDRVDPQLAQLVAMGVTAISPWALLFSRGGWEANLATALILWGVNAFLFFIDRDVEQLDKRFSLKREEKVMGWLVISCVCLCLSMYAYHSARLVAPLVGLGLLVMWWWRATTSLTKTSEKVQFFIRKNIRFLLAGIGVSLLLLLPLMNSLRSVETNQRFNETNIFADLQLLQKSQQLQADAGNTFLAHIFYHRYLIYGQAVVVQFLSHFSLDFLFVSGDSNVRHSIQFMGQLYHIEALFLLLGLWQLLRRKQPLDWLLVWWLIVGILPAAMTKAAPHALRILPTLPVWMVLITSGILSLFELGEAYRLRFKAHLPGIKRTGVLAIIGVLVVGAYLVEFVMFWRFYSVIYPKLYAGAFNDGDKQMILAMNQASQKEPTLPLVIMRSRGRPSVYYWFYSQTDPHLVQIANDTAPKDQGEFLAFENVTFPVKTDAIVSPSLVAVTVDNYPLLTGKNLDQADATEQIIRDTNGEPRWVILKY